MRAGESGIGYCWRCGERCCGGALDGIEEEKTQAKQGVCDIVPALGGAFHDSLLMEWAVGRSVIGRAGAGTGGMKGA